jgi:hypothetical protein
MVRSIDRCAPVISRYTEAYPSADSVYSTSCAGDGAAGENVDGVGEVGAEVGDEGAGVVAGPDPPDRAD